MCIRRDEPEGVCGGGSGEIQWDESEGKAAQAQGLSPGKVPELGWSQLAWKALGMEMVSQGQQEGAGRAAWVRSWGNTGRAVPAWSVPWDCRQAPSPGTRLPWRSTESPRAAHSSLGLHGFGEEPIWQHSFGTRPPWGNLSIPGGNGMWVRTRGSAPAQEPLGASAVGALSKKGTSLEEGHQS